MNLSPAYRVTLTTQLFNLTGNEIDTFKSDALKTYKRASVCLEKFERIT